MGTRVKTTIDIADGLFLEAKRVAAEEGVTLRQLVEQGLRQVLAERKLSERFVLREASFEGTGLSEEAQRLSWGEIVDRTYEGRGS